MAMEVLGIPKLEPEQVVQIRRPGPTHTPMQMEWGEKIGESHRAVVRGKLRERRHWIRVLRCPACLAERRMLAHIVQPMTCDGESQRRTFKTN